MKHLELLIATSNRGKFEELQELLAQLPFELCSLSQYPEIETVAETGATFAENAVLKAQGYALQTGLTTIADDTGLEVDALGGAPGIHSARYAGDGASDEARVQKLLWELSVTAGATRSARFVCAIAVAHRSGAILNLSTGVCAGRIREAPKGANGFGYDPIFVPDGFDQTFAELDSQIKNAISHRGQALKKAAEFLRSLTVP